MDFDTINLVRERGNLTRSSNNLEKYSWQRTVIDSQNSINGEISLALDSEDNPHVLYFSKNYCYYAYSDGKNWTTEFIANSFFSYAECSLVLDKNNYPHVCFNSESTNLTYGYFNGTSWFFEVINQNFSSYLDLAVDSNGLPHIVYRGTNASLIYDHYNGSAWVKKIFNNVVDCYGASIKLDSNDNPHITCSNRGSPDELKYFHFDGYGWQNITVPGILSYTTTVLELDFEGQPHIFYLVKKPDNTLHYVHNTRDKWEGTTVGPVNSVVFSFQLGSNGLPYYVNRGRDNEIRFARFNGTSWYIERTGLQGYFTSVSYFKLDSKDNPHLIYTIGDGKYVNITYVTKLNEIIPPVADAGEDITINRYETVFFNASKSYDNVGISNYSWLIPVDNSTLRTFYGEKVTFLFNDAGDHNVYLNVIDYSNNWAADNLTIRVIEVLTPTVELNYPQNQAILPGPDVTLSWKVVDFSAESYDVYFGNSSDPPLYRPKINTTNLEVQIIDETEVYYWKVQAQANGTLGPISPVWSFKVAHGIPEFDLNISSKYYDWQIVQGSSGKFSVTVENEGSLRDRISLNIERSNLPDSIFIEISENEIDLDPNQSIEIIFNIQTNDTTPVGLYSFSITAISKGSLEYSMGVRRSIQINLTITTGPPKDLDGDNLPDSWEIDWFDNIDKYDGEDDPDGDGKINLDEFEDDTNPLKFNVKTDDESSFLIIAIFFLIITLTILLILLIRNRSKRRDGEYL